MALRGNDIAEKVWNFLTDAGINEFGTAGLMGNIQAESGMNPKNLENLCEKRLKEAGKPYCTDETYTAAVDNGEISREEFLHPLPGKQYGYGLTQLTSAGRKAGLYDLAKSKGKSIGDLETQLEFLMIELKTSYKTAYNAIKDAASIKAASDIVLKKFEIPADQSESVQNKRAANGQEFYNRFSKTGSKGGNNMSIRIGHASISENGTINGVKGDSTGKEVCIREWYSKPWDYMAIHPDANVREKHAAAVEAACKNDNIGYSQYGTDNRNTLNTLAKAVNYDLSKVGKCNCDCSSLQNVAAVASGSGATYGSNGWTTSTMKAALQALGYKIITSSTYLKDSAYCVRGAIYVKASSHTVCGLDNGSKASQTLSAAGISGGSSGNAGTSSSTAGKKVESAKSFDKSLAGTYKTKGSLYLRAGAGKNKPDLVIMPDNTTVRNYGYYTLVDGVKWLYVQAVVKGVTYTGFCSSNTNYLKKL